MTLRKYNQVGDTIRLEASVESNETIDAATKLSTFIREYRNDETALLELGRVASISGYDSLRFGVNFTLK